MGQITNEVEGVINERRNRREHNNEINRQRQLILDQMERDTASKTNLIAKNQARQRAKWGAGGGMTGTGKTERATLGRIERETADPFVERRIRNEERLEDLEGKRISRGQARRNLINRFLTGHVPNLIG
ncbi:MAG: hypothetical protein FWC83_02185 [Alphaproteobacteria bacterium]|nr:hypothetical protein [Alphaproteobacteria bacterium]